MSVLERPRTSGSTPAVTATTPRWAVLAAGGALAAVVLIGLLAVPAVLAVLHDPQGSHSWVGAIAFAPVLWAWAHRGVVQVPEHSVTVSLPVLALMLFAVWIVRLVAARAIQRLKPPKSALWWRDPLMFAGGYAGAGGLLCLLCWGAPARPSPLTVLPGALVIGMAGWIWATVRAGRAGAAGFGAPRAGLRSLGRRMPVIWQRAARPALEGAGMLLLVGAAFVLITVGLGFQRIEQINGQLGLGTTGSVLLGLAQVLALPNLAAWASAWLGGASVYVGPVGLGHALITPGVLPMVPVLGALPEAGAAPAWAPFAPVVPVLVGCVIGWRAVRTLASLTAVRTKVLTAICAGALAGALVGLLAILGSMGLRPGQLAMIGPSLISIPLLTAECALGAGLSALIVHHRRVLR